MRLKNVPDQEIASLIKKGEYSILSLLFERNYVNALNLGEKHEFSQKKIQRLLANTCTIVWQYFSSNTWQSSKHKLDFIIDYIFRTLLIKEQPNLSIKLKAQFQEVDRYIAQYLNEPNENVVSNAINNFKVLKENQKLLIWNHFFEKKALEKVSEHIGIDEEKAEKQLYKGFVKWAELLKINLKKNIDTQLLNDNVEALLLYSTAKAKKEAMLKHELSLSSNKGLKKIQDFVDEMGEIASLTRRLTLVDYISKNSSTRLTGNIWGNKASIASAIFIVIIGILVWVADNTPDHKKNLYNLENKAVIDSPQTIEHGDTIQ